MHSVTSFLETPLHCAARNGHNDVFKLLLEWGADGSAKDMELYTPSKRARQAKSKALRNPGFWDSIFERKSNTKALPK